jgi:hypothetical protein
MLASVTKKDGYVSNLQKKKTIIKKKFFAQTFSSSLTSFLCNEQAYLPHSRVSYARAS